MFLKGLFHRVKAIVQNFKLLQNLGKGESSKVLKRTKQNISFSGSLQYNEKDKTVSHCLSLPFTLYIELAVPYLFFLSLSSTSLLVFISLPPHR